MKKRNALRSKFKVEAVKKDIAGSKAPMHTNALSTFLSSSSAVASFVSADLFLGGLMTCTALATASLTTLIYQAQSICLEKKVTWTTDAQEKVTGTTLQRGVYKIAQNEIYRLNTLKTEGNAKAVVKEIDKIKAQAHMILKGLDIKLLDRHPDTPRQLPKPFKI